MENKIVDVLYRKILLIDQLNGERDVCHELFRNYSNYRYLLVGPPKCGRTSLLFEYAFCAAENNMNVLYITRRRLEALPHFLGDRTQPCMDVLKRIHLFYPCTFGECVEFLSNVRLKEENMYHVICVDDMDLYLQDNMKDLTKNTTALSAMLVDTVAHYSQKIGMNVMLLCTMGTNSLVYQYTCEELEIYFRNKILYYPHHSKNGYVIKSETKAWSLLCCDAQNDRDIKNIHATFNSDNRIELTH